MILHIPLNEKNNAKKIQKKYNGFLIKNNNEYVCITSSSHKVIDKEYEEFITDKFIFDNDSQLTSRSYKFDTIKPMFGNVELNNKTTVLTSGPCSVESEEQIMTVAEKLVSLGLTTIRGGCYKPRTSPYSFQGMGLDGLKLLSKVREKYGLSVVSEVRDSSHLNEILEYSDVVQIGAKSMYDHNILKACGQSNKTILLKRGFGTTLQELVQMAEFIMSLGNENVVLCERGIRTFENKTRFTLDLCGVSYLKEYTRLPIFLDPSHAMGYSYGISDLSKACISMGVEGLLIESHPNPNIAKSDASQQITLDHLETLYGELKGIAKVIKRKLI